MATGRKQAGNETALVRACLDYLTLKRIFAWRANSGAMTAEHQGKKRFIRFSGAKGLSDIIGILPDGRFLAVECKVGRNTTTEDQAAFLKRIQRNGGAAFVVYSLDDLIAAIEGPGDAREITKKHDGNVPR